jgi:hypothetical protein
MGQCPPVISVLGRLRQEDQEFEVRPGDVAQAVEHLLCKLKTMSSNHRTTHTHKKFKVDLELREIFLSKQGGKKKKPRCGYACNPTGSLRQD